MVYNEIIRGWWKVKIIFEFDDTKPEYYENNECHKLYAMQNAEMLGFCIEKMFDKIRDWEKNECKYNVSTDEVREALLEIIQDNGINMGMLGY